MVSEATERKYAKQLLDKYKEHYTKRFGKAPLVNSYKDLWGFRHMYDDLGNPRAGEVVEYYFSFPNKFNQSLSELFNNYHSYSERIDEIIEDDAKRAEIRRETAQRVKEWEAKNGESSGTTS